MSQTRTLKTMEILLESFLDRAVNRKEKQMQVMSSISRLGDLATESAQGQDVTDRVGEWFASHNRWLSDSTLAPEDMDRITFLLGSIAEKLNLVPDDSPARNKISTEIRRWTSDERIGPGKLVLNRPAETSEPITENGSNGLRIDQIRDTVGNFTKIQSRLNNLYLDYAADKKHLLTVLDDTLKASILQKNKEALLLSAQIIYYLKIGGYKVEPYVLRLKEAEKLIKGDFPDA